MKTPILFVTFFIIILYSHFMYAAEVSLSSLESILAANNGDAFYVADTTSNCVYLVDASNNKIISSLALPGAPTGMALSDDDNILYVTCDGANPCLAIVKLPCMKINAQISLQAGACAPLLLPQGNQVLVCERFTGQAAFIDLDALVVQARITVGREPIAADITPDGKWILIANHLPEGASNQYKKPGGIRATKLRGATVQMINLNCASERKTIDLMLGSTGLKDIEIASNGKYAVVPHILAYYRRPTKQVKRGRINRNALSIIDLDKRELYNTILLDDYNHGAANPWRVAFSDDGNLLAVTHAGSHEVSLIQFNTLLNTIHSMPMYGYANYGGKAYSQASIPFDLTFIERFRKRISLHGLGPRGVVFARNQFHVTCAFSAHLEAISRDGKIVSCAKLIDTPVDSDHQSRSGEFYFNDASICLEEWQSCASCHPEGRMDGINWDLLNDGEGNSKNTKSLLYSHETPPVMSAGVRKNATVAIHAGLQHMMELKDDKEVAAAISVYLKSLNPRKKLTAGVPSNIVNSIKSGHQIFYSNEAQCFECHNGTFFTDLEKYDVDTMADYDQRSEFDTPSLIEIWRTAPYLHDGRAATLKELFTQYNKNDFHGKTSHLTNDELDDLVAYLESL